MPLYACPGSGPGTRDSGFRSRSRVIQGKSKEIACTSRDGDAISSDAISSDVTTTIAPASSSTRLDPQESTAMAWTYSYIRKCS